MAAINLKGFPNCRCTALEWRGGLCSHLSAAYWALNLSKCALSTSKEPTVTKSADLQSPSVAKKRRKSCSRRLALRMLNQVFPPQPDLPCHLCRPTPGPLGHRTPHGRFAHRGCDPQNPWPLGNPGTTSSKKW